MAIDTDRLAQLFVPLLLGVFNHLSRLLRRDPRLFGAPLIQEAFIDAKVQVPKLNFPCIVATTEPATAWHGVILLADALGGSPESKRGYSKLRAENRVP